MSKPICRYIFETRSFILVFFWFSACSYNVQFILLYYLYLYTYSDVRHNFHIRWCSCRLTATPPVSLVGQELLTFPEHMSSLLVTSGVRVVRSVVFCAVFCRSLFINLFYFCWPLYCLSFGIFNLILHILSPHIQAQGIL